LREAEGAVPFAAYCNRFGLSSNALEVRKTNDCAEELLCK